MSYDLVLMATPDTALSANEMFELVQTFRKETNLDGPCELTDLMMDSVGADTETLEECFESGEFVRSEFEAFCTSVGLKPEPDSGESGKAASLFLASKWGLFSLGLPSHEDMARNAYQKIVAFARGHSLIVDDPQAGRSIDLNNPGDLPPQWK